MEHAGVFVNFDDLVKVVSQAFDDADSQLAQFSIRRIEQLQFVFRKANRIEDRWNRTRIANANCRVNESLGVFDDVQGSPMRLDHPMVEPDQFGRQKPTKHLDHFVDWDIQGLSSQNNQLQSLPILINQTSRKRGPV